MTLYDAPDCGALTVVATPVPVNGGNSCRWWHGRYRLTLISDQITVLRRVPQTAHPSIVLTAHPEHIDDATETVSERHHACQMGAARFRNRDPGDSGRCCALPGNYAGALNKLREGTDVCPSPEALRRAGYPCDFRVPLRARTTHPPNPRMAAPGVRPPVRPPPAAVDHPARRSATIAVLSNRLHSSRDLTDPAVHGFIRLKAELWPVATVLVRQSPRTFPCAYQRAG